jgi:PAS domain S-box-containing protein
MDETDAGAGLPLSIRAQIDPELWASPQDAVVVAHVASASIVGWNATAERIFGYSAHEARGMPVEVLASPSFRSAHVAGFSRFQRTNEAATLGAEHPSNLQGMHKGGDLIALHARLFRLESTPAGERFLLAVLQRADSL